MTFKTEQEVFWADEFGTEYIQRNQGYGFIYRRDPSFLQDDITLFFDGKVELKC